MFYMMERYKQYLCNTILGQYIPEDTIYEHIKGNSQYRCNLNEEGKLHSNYTGSYYEPAIIHTEETVVCLFWLFDGKIKDCNHPFRIDIIRGKIERIQYYSSEKIQNEQPILLIYSNRKLYSKSYNQYYKYTIGTYVSILHGFDNKNVSLPVEDEYLDESLFTSECYPLCDPIDLYKFKLKFAD